MNGKYAVIRVRLKTETQSQSSYTSLVNGSGPVANRSQSGSRFSPKRVAGPQEGASRSHSVVPVCTTLTVAMKPPATEPRGRPVLARAWGAPRSEHSWWVCNTVWLLWKMGSFSKQCDLCVHPEKTENVSVRHSCTSVPRRPQLDTVW